jgi:peptide deformylase
MRFPTDFGVWYLVSGSLLPMAVYPIRTFPDPVLAMKARSVETFDDDLTRLTDDMFETMYDAPGVGLAAPQIGVSKRVFVADIGDGPFLMINPSIVDQTGRWKYEEGCLSVPGRYWDIKRSDYARAEGFDLRGNPIMYEGDELMGRVLQHEIDHLFGLLLLSHLGSRTKRQALKELREESLDAQRGM